MTAHWATLRGALERGECIVKTTRGDAHTRTSDPADAERIASRIGGYVIYPQPKCPTVNPKAAS